jgi:arylsulfatase A-like enzyme
MLKLKLIALALIISASANCQETDQPNILFIFCDDLNVSGLGTLIDPHVFAPTIDSLVAEGAVFTNAHANATLCAPSRASVFTGVLPTTSGYYGRNTRFEPWTENAYLSEASTVFAHMKGNGYNVYASGKIFHKGVNPLSDFDEYNDNPFQGPYPYENRTHSILPEVLSPLNISFSPLEEIPSYSEGPGWYANGQPFFFESEENRDLLGDELSVIYCDSIFDVHSNSSDQPFFLTLGLYKPHAPFHVPQRYFDLYPLENIDISDYEIDNIDFAAAAFNNRFNANSNKHIETLTELSPEDDPLLYLKKFKQGYYASVSFVDDILKDILRSLSEHGLTDNTFIIFSSDHGYHLGSKRIIHKSTLWNGASRVPLVIAGPDINPSVIDKAVSLVDVYPTILDIANIQPPVSHPLDGGSLRKINGPDYPKEKIISNACIESVQLGDVGLAHHQHHSLLMDDFKYILYSSGEDELYNVIEDGEELFDLTLFPAFQQIRKVAHQILADKIDSIRLPAPSYMGMFYGDFEQDLNGWLPSESDELRYVEGPNDIFDSKHLVLVNSTSGTTENKSINLKTTGEYVFKFKAYSETTTANLKVELKISLDGNVSTVFNETFSIDNTAAEYELPFLYTPEDNDVKYSLRLRVLNGEEIHVDDMVIMNSSIELNSRVACIEASPLAVDVPFFSIVKDTLITIPDQPDFSSKKLSGLTQQKWYTVIPETEIGLIITRSVPTSNPVIEISEDCESSASSDKFFDLRTNALEYGLVKNLTPGQEMYVRIGNGNKNLQSRLPVTSFYQNLEFLVPEIQNNTLTTNSPIYPNFSIDSMVVQIRSLSDSSNIAEYSQEYIENGQYDLSQINLDAGTYEMRISYSLDFMDIQIPFGPGLIFESTSSGISVMEGLPEPSFNLAPNPVPDGLNQVVISRNSDVSAYPRNVSLQDITGKVLSKYSTNFDTEKMGIHLPGGLASGLYFLVIDDNSGRRSVLKIRL